MANELDQALFNAIRNGKGKMPPEAEGRARTTEVWNLIIYIRGMSKGHAAAADNRPENQRGASPRHAAPEKPDNQPDHGGGQAE